MPKEQADKLLPEVISLSEVRDLEALRKYDFVSMQAWSGPGRASVIPAFRSASAEAAEARVVLPIS